MPWSRAGTVAVTHGSPTVTGINTGFAANSRVGDAFIGPDGRQYELGNVASDTVISIIPAYQGPSADGAAYSIMPVQGYQKGLADQVRDWVNVYGQKMAGLGTTGDYEVLPVAKGGTGAVNPVDARSGLGLGSVSVENVVPVAKGGTGGTTPAAARAGLGLGSAAVAAILGTVSQVDGVPTGALMEYGSNGAGEYWRFAGGLQITSQTIPVTGLSWTATATHRYLNFTAGLPATFAVKPRTFGNMLESDIATRSAWLTNVDASSVSAMSLWLAAPAGTSGSGGFSIAVLAVGRWF